MDNKVEGKEKPRKKGKPAQREKNNMKTLSYWRWFLYLKTQWTDLSQDESDDITGLPVACMEEVGKGVGGEVG